MAAKNSWRIARSPNYETNNNKLYPYSELPFEVEYKLLKIPVCVKNLINHVDYWGEGKKELPSGVTGFPDCYNINFEYNLVSDGPDEGRKIPNRIPISRDCRVSTLNYIKDNSVRLVTVHAKYKLSQFIAEEITRLVNSEHGRVVAYGFNDEDIEILSKELEETKQLLYCPIYLLPESLQLTYWNTYRVYLNSNEIKINLFQAINKGYFEKAVILMGCLRSTYCDGALGNVVYKLIEKNVANVVGLAYHLWITDNKDVVRKFFPPVFQLIFDGRCMAIINKQNNQALVLEPITTQAKGDSDYKSSNKLGWKTIPIWDDKNNVVLFKLFNIDSGMYLQLSPTVGEDGVRQAHGSKDSQGPNNKFYLKPFIIMKGQVAFNIYNYRNDDEQLFSESLEWPDNVDSSVVNAVLEPKGVGSKKDEGFCWILTTSKPTDQLKEKSVKQNELAHNFKDFYIY